MPLLLRSFVIGSLALVASGRANASGSLELRLQPETLMPGNVAALRITPAAKSKVPVRVKAGTTLGNVPLFPCPGVRNSLCGLVAVPLDAAPGSYRVTVGGKGGTVAVGLEVAPMEYPEEKLEVDPSLTKLSPENQKRADEERAMVSFIFARPTLAPLTVRPLEPPLNSAVTSPFRIQRLFNGQRKDPHSGVDLRAAVGTPVQTAGAGEVRLARNMFYAGNQVIVDHGLGVFTSYSHLSRLDVKPGQKLKRGETVGLAGATGRVTAPHLHWGMRVNGILVDPHQALDVLARLWAEPTRAGGS